MKKFRVEKFRGKLLHEKIRGKKEKQKKVLHYFLLLVPKKFKLLQMCIQMRLERLNMSLLCL